MSGRPRTVIGTFGEVDVKRLAVGRYRASTRYRDVDGRLRRVAATGSNARAAIALLKGRLVDRRGYGSGGVLSLASPFGELAELWLGDLESRGLAANTKENYRDDLRVHVRPFFEHYTLGEVTTGRVEGFLKAEGAVSYSRAKHSRNILNQLFGFALRLDALPRNPLEGTSPLVKPKTQIRALSLEHVQAIRAAAAVWRREPGRKGPKPDDKVRDIIDDPGRHRYEARRGAQPAPRRHHPRQEGDGRACARNGGLPAGSRFVPAGSPEDGHIGPPGAGARVRRRSDPAPVGPHDVRPVRTDDLRQQDRGSAEFTQRAANLP